MLVQSFLCFEPICQPLCWQFSDWKFGSVPHSVWVSLVSFNICLFRCASVGTDHLAGRHSELSVCMTGLITYNAYVQSHTHWAHSVALRYDQNLISQHWSFQTRLKNRSVVKNKNFRYMTILNIWNSFNIIFCMIDTLALFDWATKSIIFYYQIHPYQYCRDVYFW